MSIHRPRHLLSLLAVGAALLLSACAGDADEEPDVTTTPTSATTSSSPALPMTSTVVTATTTVPVTTAAPGTTTTPDSTSTVPTTATTGAPPMAGGCGSVEFLNDFTDPVVLFCDGFWARAGQAQTDHVLLFRFVDGQWLTHPDDGLSPVTEYPCYDEETLRSAGAPEELVGQVSLCASAD